MSLNSWLIFLSWLIYFSFLSVKERALGGLVVDVLLALLTSSELYEQVGVARVAKESLFRLFTIFVHGVTHYREIH